MGIIFIPSLESRRRSSVSLIRFAQHVGEVDRLLTVLLTLDAVYHVQRALTPPQVGGGVERHAATDAQDRREAGKRRVGADVDVVQVAAAVLEELARDAVFLLVRELGDVPKYVAERAVDLRSPALAEDLSLVVCLLGCGRRFGRMHGVVSPWGESRKLSEAPKQFT